MTRSTRIPISCLLFLVFISACSKPNPNSASGAAATPTASPSAQRITSQSVVKAQPHPVEITAGGSGEAVVRITIQNGYHLNANPPTYPYLKATELEIKPGEGVAVGKVTYPPPVTGTFAFAEKPLAVYEGTTELKAEIKTVKTAPKGNRSMTAILRIQACDDQVCYPPGAIDLQIPLTIK
ncbi:MAG: protein-disulfide reductase DsbD domain-containing protein [Acidobacteriota bacterium]